MGIKETKRLYYLRLRQRPICTCGKPKTIGDAKCSNCKDAANLRSKSHAAHRRQLGICTHCSNEAESGKTLCKEHLKRGLVRTAKHRIMRQERGLCAQCGTQPAKPGTLCKQCQDMFREYGQEYRKAAITYYGAKCTCCGETEYVFLCIDHIKGKGRQHRKEIGASALYRWLKKNNYPDGFQVLCWNCNSAKYILGKCPHQL